MIPIKFNKLAKSNTEKYFKIIDFVNITYYQYGISFNNDEMYISDGSVYLNGVINNDLSSLKFRFNDELEITYMGGTGVGLQIKIYDLNNNLIDNIYLYQYQRPYIIKQSCLIDIYSVLIPGAG